MTDPNKEVTEIITTVTVGKEIITGTETRADTKDVITITADINKGITMADVTTEGSGIITQAAEETTITSNANLIQISAQNRKNSLNHYW
jgi:hypothetical protein